MSFPRYPKYRESGVEWLGQVPEHWIVAPARRLVRAIEQGWSPDCLGRPAEPGEWGVVKSGCVNRGLFSEGENKALPEVLSPMPEYEIRAGDILMSRASGSPELVGSTAHVETTRTQLMLSDKIFRIRPEPFVEPKYFVALFNSRLMRAQIERSISGADGLANNLPQSAVKAFTCPIPPAVEQIAIAAFLDRETAKIDVLVAEQQRLMELLKEKRQAVISHAVTKGLNPHAPMKPSGLEWLGEVPAHWGVIALKRDLAFLTSGSRGWAEKYSDDGNLFIRIANLTRESIQLELSDVQRVSVPDGAEGSRTKVQAGDVLFSITAYLGSVAVVPEGLEAAFVSQHVALARGTQARLAPRWIAFAALSLVGKTWFEMQSYGGTKIQLSLDDIKELPMPAPPMAEQLAVVAYLERELAKLEALGAETQRAIDLLQERRTALISAAVTGQIDVRALAERPAA